MVFGKIGLLRNFVLLLLFFFTTVFGFLSSSFSRIGILKDRGLTPHTPEDNSLAGAV
jgi:hypothetical protein